MKKTQLLKLSKFLTILFFSLSILYANNIDKCTKEYTQCIKDCEQLADCTNDPEECNNQCEAIKYKCTKELKKDKSVSNL